MANSNIPKDWTATKLGKITNITTGKKDVNEGHEDGEYPFFTCSQKEYRINEPSFDTEAILIGGNAYFNVKYYKGKFDAYQRTYVIDGFKDNIGKYLYYVLLKDLASLTTNNQGSAVKYIKLRDLTHFDVFLPPFQERSRIIDILLTVDSVIDNTQAIINQTQTLKKALSQELFTRGIPGKHKRFKKTKNGEAPEDWELVRLADELDVKHGYAFKSIYFSDNEANNIVIVPGNFHRDGGLYFNVSNTRYYTGPIPEDFILKNGDLLIVMTDLSPKMLILGQVVELCHHKIILHNQRIGKILVKQNGWDKSFLRFLLNSQQVKYSIVKGAIGTTVKHTSPDKILSNIVVKPSLGEQNQICAMLISLEKKIEEEMLWADQLQILKIALMQVLLTGRVRIKG